MREEYFKISELNQFIRGVINAGFPQAVWICGEIQQYDRSKNKKHVFFELVEKDPDSKDIIARIGLVIFAGRKAYIEDLLRKSGADFSLKDDIEVKFACKVDFYAPHGVVRLVVESIDPVYTLGRIAQEKQRLIALLKANGILEKNKQVELPMVPLNIGLVTSYDSAAYNDFFSELQRSGFGFNIYVRNTLMQGKKAEGDVCDALDQLSRIKILDAVVITRGGGSIADLSCFDSRLIAEKIASMRLPVLSGIGHEINITITDKAAHTYAKTPTAIASFLIGTVEEFLNGVDENMQRMIDAVRRGFDKKKRGLRDSALALQNSTLGYLKEHGRKIVRISEAIKARPSFLLKAGRSVLDNSEDRFKKTVTGRIVNEKIRLGNFQKIISIVHPSNTIKRGFSIARTFDGKALKSIKSIKKGDKIVVEIVDGLIDGDCTGVRPAPVFSNE